MSSPWRPGAVPFLLAVVLVAALSCRPADDPRGAAPSASAAEPVEVPLPELERLEPAVAEQLATRPQAIEEARTLASSDPGRAAGIYGETGALYLAYGLGDAAAASLANAAALAPETLRWHYLRAVNAQRIGRREVAREAFARTLELDPGHVPAAVALGELLTAEGRPEEAARKLEEVLSRDPESPGLLAALGRAELAAGHPREAAERLGRALGLAPEAGELHYPLGLALRRSGREAEAKQFLAREATGRVPMDDPLLDEVDALRLGARLANQRGTEEFHRGDFDAAARTLREAVDAAPDDPEARHNLAAALIRLGRLEEARQELDELLRRSPDSYLGHFTLGSLRARQGLDAEAVRSYRRALALHPGHRDSHFNLANALRRLGRWSDAAEHYARALELEPGSGAAHFGLAVSLLELGRWEEALQRLEVAHAALPDDPKLAETLARVLASAPIANLRDPSRAVALAEGLTREAATLEQVETLAMALAAAGRYEEAVSHQSRALEAVRAAGVPSAAARSEAALRQYEQHIPPWER